MHQCSLRQAAFGSLVLWLLALSGCSTESSDTLGKAYVAPATLNLRGQLTQKNSAVAVLKHGERVSIVDVRRRFVKIRTQNGVEGWVDSLDLLTPEQMDQIRRERQQALALPSEGLASAYETLNIHIEPSRLSPPFAQIPEGGSVAVLAYRAEPKATGPAKAPVFTFEHPQPPARKSRKEKQAKSGFTLPPKPAPPKPPKDWQELSRGSEAETKAQASAAPKQLEPVKPVVVEEWALVRTKSNQVGWVIARNLMMRIPDEVAQYAEGRRITSYFDLGKINDDEKGPKHNWLWTTLGSPCSCDFDSWRVFLWNRRRHRYETSHRQRDVEGYFPVHVDPADTNTPGRTFALVTKDDDGKLRRRTYLFDGVRVHLTGTENYTPVQTGTPSTGTANALHSKPSRTDWLARNWMALKRKLLGGS